MFYTKLRAFHAVATQGGFSKAAAHLHVTQPTISDQVAALEREFEVLLFNRTHRSVSLTRTGFELLEIVNQMFLYEHQGLDYLSKSQALLTGNLNLAVDAPLHILTLVSQFRKCYPEVSVAIRMGNSTDVLQQLLDFEADIGVFSQGQEDPRLQVMKLREDALVAVVPKDHPWGARQAVTFEALAGEPLVLREPGSITRRLVQEEFNRLKIEPGTILDVEGREGVREAVATGNGIGFVSEPEFGFDSRLRMLTLRDSYLPMCEYLGCLKSRVNVRVVKAFWELAKA